MINQRNAFKVLEILSKKIIQKKEITVIVKLKFLHTKTLLELMIPRKT